MACDRGLRRRDFMAGLPAVSWPVLSGCKEEPSPRRVVYSGQPDQELAELRRFAILPLHNPVKLLTAYQPMVDLLNQALGVPRLMLEASRDYAAFERKIEHRGPEFILPNPWQTLIAMRHGYQVVAMAGDADDFHGLILVRRDSGIRQVSDLVGRSVSYPSPTALSACVMPQYHLHRLGLNVRRDVTHLYVGSHESSILSVLRGRTAASATWPPAWRAFQAEHPAEAAQLTVAWQTPPLLNNAVMVRSDVPAALARQLTALLLELHTHGTGRAALQSMRTARFHPSDDERYSVVRDYITRFEREVRPVEQPT